MLTIGAHEIEVLRIGSPGGDRPCLVFLHEGLGCVRMWREFPQRLAARLGLPAVVYSRLGYGQSDVFPNPPRLDYMHDAARTELPQLLRLLDVRRPILVGHSDGASIALIHAGDAGARGAPPAIAPTLVVALAPHLFVEPVCTESITRMRATSPRARMVERLAAYHRDAAATFDGWSGVWLEPGFPDWNIEPLVAAVRCPVLAIQGDADQYGTMRQLERIRALTADSLLLALPGVGHSPHLERPDRVIDAVSRYIAGVLSRARSRAPACAR